MLHLDTREARQSEDRPPTDGHATDAHATDAHATDAVARLRPLLAAAAELDLQDREAWMRLRHAARITTGALAAGGALPVHLVVGRDDSPALVTRTVTAAWRHTTSAPSRQEQA